MFSSVSQNSATTGSSIIYLKQSIKESQNAVILFDTRLSEIVEQVIPKITATLFWRSLIAP